VATISALVPAAGCGARANTKGNKVLAVLHGQPLLWWTLRALTDPAGIPSDAKLTEVIIAARGDELALIRPIVSALPDHPQPHSATTLHTPAIHLVEGGASRRQSAANAARAATGDFLLVHDAARPLLSPPLMARVCRAALDDGAAIAAVPCTDTVKQISPHESKHEGKVVIERTLDRRTLWLAQTPQVFHRAILAAALARAEADAFDGTDCASLVERLVGSAGQPLHPVTIVEGEARNFKVTYPPDFERAAALLMENHDLT